MIRPSIDSTAASSPDALTDEATAVLDNVCVVLFEPQDDINIGNTVRACKNFGVRDIRLVRPAQADPDRIGISAPKAGDVIANMRRFDGLDEALADCVLVAGTTARARSAARAVAEPRGAATRLVEATDQGKVALMFGREDSGLPNEALDRCHLMVTVPTDPAYSSLNLGQAVLLHVWEVFRVATGAEVVAARAGAVDTAFDPAPMGVVERMFAQAERSLAAIEFFKVDSHDHIMRSVRSVLLRAGLDERELAIWFGIFKEIEKFLERKGVLDADRPR